MTKEETKIGMVYMTRKLIADEMEETAKLLKDPRTLDSDCDEGFKNIYEGFIKTLAQQICLEKDFKR